MRKSAAKAEMNQSRSTSQKIDHMIDHSPAPPPQLLAAPVSVQGQRRARQHHQPPQMAVFDLVRGHQQSLWLRGPSAVAGEAMASDGVVKLRPNCAGSAVCPDCASRCPCPCRPSGTWRGANCYSACICGPPCWRPPWGTPAGAFAAAWCGRHLMIERRRFARPACLQAFLTRSVSESYLLRAVPLSRPPTPSPHTPCHL